MDYGQWTTVLQATAALLLWKAPGFAGGDFRSLTFAGIG